MDPQETRRRVADRIREITARRRWTLNDLAERCEVSRSHVFAVLSGKRAATTDVLTKIANTLDVDPHELLRPSRSKPKARKKTPSSSGPSEP